MSGDRSEMHDLAPKYPERVKKLAAKWDAIAARADVLPARVPGASTNEIVVHMVAWSIA